ncbi:sulfotransferase [Yoonia sp. I 8.24]|uniref:tetratricopeptide repeat-containing sulfotransferase family protein n=1 Tax=Yoonia sp. I 8.24 TaxID=1537229 RepID=UPI001EDE4EC0|nr:sulfotransferase [Yoonia sp. I 8.24]MCG3268867.1 sulfotransferase [Yoonia sp. I 8.24]
MAKASKSPLISKAKEAEAAGQNFLTERILIKVISDSPKDPTAYAMLIRLYTRKMKKTDMAIALLPKLLKLAPRSALAHELAAECFCKKNMFESAKIHADQTVKLGPKSPDGLYVAATVYFDTEDYAAATKCMEACLAIRPEHLPSRLLYAKSLRGSGELTKSEAICREIFKEYPDSLANYSIWHQACKITADDPIYLHIRDTVYPTLLDKKLPGRIPLLRILGKAENDIGNFETSFQHYTDAKELTGKTHDRTVNKMFVSAVISGVSRADYFGAPGSDSENPVLVVGMPRTGSTLLEQILSSHPQIGGIGESKNLRDAASKAGIKFHDGASLVNAIHKLTPDQAQELAADYLQKSTDAQPGMLRIVDKNLHNFEILGFYAKLFPKARILNALRDPMDNCVSCYLAPLSKFHSYTQDLTSLGQYYSEFRRLMDHWKKVLPNPIMEVHYEDVVADTEGKAREVIDFLGLDWDPACLSFQENENQARTISTWQVRQPIYKSSVKRWARYEQHLDPLKAELKQFYPDGF